MARFGVAIAYRDKDDQVVLTACMVDAATKFEADGLGLAIARKLHPRSEGNYNHTVSTSLPDVVVHLESVVLSKP